MPTYSIYAEVAEQMLIIAPSPEQARQLFRKLFFERLRMAQPCLSIEQVDDQYCYRNLIDGVWREETQP